MINEIDGLFTRAYEGFEGGLMSRERFFVLAASKGCEVKGAKLTNFLNVYIEDGTDGDRFVVFNGGAGDGMMLRVPYARCGVPVSGRRFIKLLRERIGRFCPEALAGVWADRYMVRVKRSGCLYESGDDYDAFIDRYKDWLEGFTRFKDDVTTVADRLESVG